MMNIFAVSLVTALPVLLGMWLGRYVGGGRTIAWLAKLVLAWGAGIGLAVFGFRTGWHWPLGLISPIFGGLLTATLLSKLLICRLKESQRQATLGFLQRTSGTLLGGIIGFVLAIVGWHITLLVISLTSPLSVAQIENAKETQTIEERDEELPEVAKPTKISALASLANVAHEGFIKHLPYAGPATEEMLAITKIVNTPGDVRRQYAKQREWDALAELPSFRAIANDEALFAEIDSVIGGNFAALYRLQKHPLVIEFFHEEQLQAIIADVQASEIASELQQLEKEMVDQGLR